MIRLLVEHPGYALVENWKHCTRNVIADVTDLQHHEITIVPVNENKIRIWLHEETKIPDDFLRREIKYRLNRRYDKQQHQDLMQTISRASFLVNVLFLLVVTASFFYMLGKDFHYIQVP